MYLKLNIDKMEFIMFGSRQILKYANTSQLDFDISLIQQNKLVKYLGGHLTFEEHIKQKSKAAVLNFTKIKAIRPSLSATACITLVLMYAFLIWTTQMQCYTESPRSYYKYTKEFKICVQNWSSTSVSMTECLKQLHLLPIEQ